MPGVGGSTAAPLARGEAPGTWERRAASPAARARSFTHTLHVIATPRRELEPLIFFIKMQINLIKSGIVN